MENQPINFNISDSLRLSRLSQDRLWSSIEETSTRVRRTFDSVPRISYDQSARNEEIQIGQSVLREAAENFPFPLWVHGTSDVPFEDILESGEVIHGKGLAQYASLAALGGSSSLPHPHPYDEGSGLIFPNQRILNNDQNYFVFDEETGDCKVPIDDRVFAIIVPQSKANAFRKKITSNSESILSQYLPKIFSYEEFACLLNDALLSQKN